MKLLETKHLNIHYQTERGKHHAVRDVSIHVDQGELVSIVGESGSGKSTLALSIGQLLPKRQTKITGELLFHNHDVNQMSKEELLQMRKANIAYIFQEPAVSLNPVFTIKEQMKEVMPGQLDDSIEEILRNVHLREPQRVLASYPHELSGGMKQRVMIAMAVAKEPDLIIADEPTTALDATVQKEILRLLIELNQNKNMAVLFITHDLNVAKAISNRILVMKDGALVEEVSASENYELKEAYSKKLFTSSLLQDKPKTMIEI